MSLLTQQMLANNSDSNSTPSVVDSSNDKKSNQNSVSKFSVYQSDAKKKSDQQIKETSSTNQLDLSNLFCISISLAVKYFRSTSYLWMFNEGKSSCLIKIFYIFMFEH